MILVTLFQVKAGHYCNCRGVKAELQWIALILIDLVLQKLWLFYNHAVFPAHHRKCLVRYQLLGWQLKFSSCLLLLVPYIFFFSVCLAEVAHGTRSPPPGSIPLPVLRLHHLCKQDPLLAFGNHNPNPWQSDWYPSQCRSKWQHKSLLMQHKKLQWGVQTSPVLSVILILTPPLMSR